MMICASAEDASSERVHVSYYYTLKIVERWIYTAGFVLVVINAGFFYFVPVTPEPTWLPQYDSR